MVQKPKSDPPLKKDSLGEANFSYNLAFNLLSTPTMVSASVTGSPQPTHPTPNSHPCGHNTPPGEVKHPPVFLSSGPFFSSSPELQQPTSSPSSVLTSVNSLLPLRLSLNPSILIQDLNSAQTQVQARCQPHCKTHSTYVTLEITSPGPQDPF